MFTLPLALALSDRYGRLEAIATFADAVDLWTFYEAWRPDVSNATSAQARFVKTGSTVRTTYPPATKAETVKWADARP